MNEARSDIYSSVCKAFPTESKLFCRDEFQIFSFWKETWEKLKLAASKPQIVKRSKDQLKGMIVLQWTLLYCAAMWKIYSINRNIVAWWNSLSLFGTDLTIFSCWRAVALNSIPWFSIDIITATFHEVKISFEKYLSSEIYKIFLKHSLLVV